MGRDRHLRALGAGFFCVVGASRHKTLAAVTEAIEGFRYNSAVARIREFSNSLGEFTPTTPEQQRALTEAVETLLILLQPMMPHLAAELWHQTGHIDFLCQPAKASALRTVIAIADRMPEIGKTFYETGPSTGIRKLADYLKAQTDAGVLKVDDLEVAAAQFMETCQGTLFKPVLFNFAPPPPAERIAHVVSIAVRVFMAAYRAR